MAIALTEKEYRTTPVWALPTGSRGMRRRWACNLLVFLILFLTLSHYMTKQELAIKSALHTSLRQSEQIQAEQLQAAVTKPHIATRSVNSRTPAALHYDFKKQTLPSTTIVGHTPGCTVSFLASFWRTDRI